MKVLVACECSGVVRRAFLREDHDAWSCDLRPADDKSNRHIVGDARDILDDGWDLLMVAHPPCTRLCNSGVRWLHKPPNNKTREQMWQELAEGAEVFSDFWNAPIERVCIENPVMHKYAKERIRNYQPPKQTIQPHQFGHKVFKATCLFLRNLPELTPTRQLKAPAPGTDEHKRWSSIHRAPPGPDRGQIRSRFYDGIAKAMAKQWGELSTCTTNT